MIALLQPTPTANGGPSNQQLKFGLMCRSIRRRPTRRTFQFENKKKQCLLTLVVVALLFVGFLQHNVILTTNVKHVHERTAYQGRIRRQGWLSKQCDFMQELVDDDGSVFPYIEIPPTGETEISQQFETSLVNTRIAVLHVWTSNTKNEPPPFFQYWVTSAMANANIADFLIFVPDTATKQLLEKLMPAQHENVRVYIVGDFVQLYQKKLKATLQKANFELTGHSISRLKPMLGYVFEEYFNQYSHWAWADMDLVLGNLTKHLAAPLIQMFDVITMDAISYNGTHWTRDFCGRYKTAFVGQLTIFRNTKESRRYFFKSDLKNIRHAFDERGFPAAVYKISGIRIAHVFVQVADVALSKKGGSQMYFSSKRGLYLVSPTKNCFVYEAGMVHLMQAKKLVRPPQQQQQHSTLEQAIFPGPFDWSQDNNIGFDLYFPASESKPWVTHTHRSEKEDWSMCD